MSNSTELHSSHDLKVLFDSSLSDYKCVKCGARDISGAGWGRLMSPCKIPSKEEKSK